MKGEDGAVLISMRLNSGTGGSGSRLRSVVKICKQKIDCQIDSLLLLIRIDPFFTRDQFPRIFRTSSLSVQDACRYHLR
jgi:hypothetical protein